MKPYVYDEVCAKCGGPNSDVTWVYWALSNEEVLKVTCACCGHAAYRAPLDAKSDE